MRALAWFVSAALVVAVTTPPETAAISRRKACRLACTAAVDSCVGGGGKRARCKRQTLKSCRKQGLEACATTSTTTSPGATTTTQTTVASTTTLGGVTTTTTAGSTTTIASATTTTPGPTTTTTTIVVHGCNSSTATDLSGQASPTVTFASYQYTPPCARIVAGQTITFSGTLSFHPLVGGVVGTPDPSSPIGIQDSGTSAPISFQSAGVFPYYCGQHGLSQNMVGAVFVDP